MFNLCGHLSQINNSGLLTVSKNIFRKTRKRTKKCHGYSFTLVFFFVFFYLSISLPYLNKAEPKQLKILIHIMDYMKFSMCLYLMYEHLIQLPLYCMWNFWHNFPNTLLTLQYVYHFTKHIIFLKKCFDWENNKRP